MAARYGCLPSMVNTLTPEELLVAIEAISEDSKDQFRIASFPVWLEHGKKGDTFGKFLRKIGMGTSTSGVKKSKKLNRKELDKLYSDAESIKSRMRDGTV